MRVICRSVAQGVGYWSFEEEAVRPRRDDDNQDVVDHESEEVPHLAFQQIPKATTERLEQPAIAQRPDLLGAVDVVGDDDGGAPAEKGEEGEVEQDGDDEYMALELGRVQVYVRDVGAIFG